MVTCHLCPPEAKCPGPSADPGDWHWDGTDAAHPAWWRGEKYGVESACRELDKVIKNPGSVLRGRGSEPWESTRLRVAVLAASQTRSSEVVAIWVLGFLTGVLAGGSMAWWLASGGMR